MTALTLTSLGLSLMVLGHRLPDHVVERAVQVTVYPQRIEIVYQIGFNEVTLAEQLRSLAPDVPVPDSPEQTLEIYRQRILPRLADGLQVQLDGKPVTVQPREARRATLHHAQLECVMEVPLSSDDPPVSLKVHDQNFASDPGGHRMAAKGRDGPRLLNNSVPPILARVAQVPDDQLSDEQRASRRWIEAEIGWPAHDPLAADRPVSPLETGQPLASGQPMETGQTTASGEPGDPGRLEQPARPESDAEAPGPRSLKPTSPPLASRDRSWWPVSGQTVLVVIGALCLLVGGGFLLAQQKRERGAKP